MADLPVETIEQLPPEEQNSTMQFVIPPGMTGLQVFSMFTTSAYAPNTIYDLAQQKFGRTAPAGKQIRATLVVQMELEDVGTEPLYPGPIGS